MFGAVATKIEIDVLGDDPENVGPTRRRAAVLTAAYAGDRQQRAETRDEESMYGCVQFFLGLSMNL
jgi:hypothetical protein